MALAAELGVQDRLSFDLDPDDNAVAELYATAACAVFPSRLEGYGIGPLEARKASCPVAASDIPAHCETLGEGAAMFGVDDAQGCARAIMDALKGPAPAPGLFVPRTWDQCADAWASGLTQAASAG